MLGLIGFNFYFFRNPQRICYQAVYNNKILICPADGKITDIVYDPENNLEGSFTYKISICISLFLDFKTFCKRCALQSTSQVD